jgi:protein-disulfide isomerase
VRGAASARPSKQRRTGFWAVHDALYQSQPTLDDAALARIAQDNHVTQTKKHHASIDDDVALEKSLGIDGTPVFFINGRKLTGAQEQTKFSAIIEEELASAKARIAGGTPRAKLYDEIMKDAE